MMRKHWKEALSFAAAMMSFLSFADAEAEKAARRFATGGEVTSFRYEDATGIGWTAFLHTFTNTAEAAEFQNTSGKTLPVRLLAVGGGGAGMDGTASKYSTTQIYGGGGGGGGGVTETNALLSANDVWSIRVGSGGAITNHAVRPPRVPSGVSSVSNGLVEIVLTPGGGAGASRYNIATAGAAGGGGSNVNTDGADGIYASSIMNNYYGPFDGGNAYGCKAGGGGGAGSNGGTASTEGGAGGIGLASDITGTSVVYGSGGGGGGYYDYKYATFGTGGNGGDGAGNGGQGELVITDGGATTNVTITPATAPAANRGGGGGGGVSCRPNGVDHSPASETYGTDGADGVVIIRYDIPDTPCVGGDVVTVTTNGNRVIYIHKFANTTVAATFTPSVAFDGTSVRLLAVGGGGAGMDGTASKYSGTKIYGGGGGGGGGVTETNALLSAGDVWSIRVGAGGRADAHGISEARVPSSASSVSNGVVELVLTPGGGAGGSRNVKPTDGAAGGGGSLHGSGSGGSLYGADGKYVSSILGQFYGPFSGGDGDNKASGTDNGWGGGGGGAGSAGDGRTGGTGLASDITGATVVYGAGGGGGGYFDYRRELYGTGGDGAGNGGKIVLEGDVLTFTPASKPAANSGGGGGGGLSCREESTAHTPAEDVYGSDGADGVVIIRYEVKMPKGFMIIFK